MRQWNKETINEQLKLHKKQNKDERYNYFSREFNSLWYCWELEKYTISLQTQLQQKENIIKEVREYIEMHTPSDIGICGNKTKRYYTLGEDSVDHILEILDKGVD